MAPLIERSSRAETAPVTTSTSAKGKEKANVQIADADSDSDVEAILESAAPLPAEPEPAPLPREQPPASRPEPAQPVAGSSKSTGDTTDPPLPPDAPPGVENAPRNGDWSAIWSPQMSAYYFYNHKTGLTTWDNPLDQKDDGPKEPTAADYGGIDPDLAYLDPTLKYGVRQGLAGAHTARFNSRTGKFEGDPERTPDAHSHVGQQRRELGQYYDLEAWDQQRNQEQQQRIAQGLDPSLRGARRENVQKLTKTQLEYFKQKTAEKRRKKKIAFLINDEGRESRGPGARRGLR